MYSLFDQVLESVRLFCPTQMSDFDILTFTSIDFGAVSQSRTEHIFQSCSLVFARNLLTAINYIIVFAAFVSCLLLIISYLRQQDTDRTINSDDFALFRASVLVQFILSCLVS
jgi:hypothetical protein